MADQKGYLDDGIQLCHQNILYPRLAQGFSRALSAFSGFMREDLGKVIKADQCAQYDDDSGITANGAEQLIGNLRVTSQCIQNAGLKLTMHKSRFGATDLDFLGRTITPVGVRSLFETTKIQKSKKALQRFLRFLNYYRNYIPRLSEKTYSSLQTSEKR